MFLSRIHDRLKFIQAAHQKTQTHVFVEQISPLPRDSHSIIAEIADYGVVIRRELAYLLARNLPFEISPDEPLEFWIVVNGTPLPPHTKTRPNVERHVILVNEMIARTRLRICSLLPGFKLIVVESALQEVEPA